LLHARCLLPRAIRFLAISCVTMSSIANIEGDVITQDQSFRIVQKYKGVFLTPPTRIDSSMSTDAPLLGNGNLGVALLGNIDAMTFVLGKNEFWSLEESKVKAMCRLNLSVPGMAGAAYHMEQDLVKAEVTGLFGRNGNSVTTRSWVEGADTTDNYLVTTLANSGSESQAISVSLACGNQNKNEAPVGSSGNLLYIDVRADRADSLGDVKTCQVRIATTVIGADASITSDTLNFTLEPGKAATLLTSVVSNYDSASHESQALDALKLKTPADIDALLVSHEAYWRNFYGQSFIEIPDKRLEAEWYASLYLMASCSHSGEVPPGLFGNWILEKPNWNGDYTLNYNYEAPFWLTIPTNHLELMDNYDKPLIDWLPHAEALAEKHGWKGAYYQVHIGPLPNGSADKSEHNQKFCGAYAATPILMRFYSTRDLAYAARVYPMLKEVAIFWQNYLVWDGSHYDIKDDAQQEDDPDPQVNGVMSLGMVRYLLQGCIDMSSDLHVDDSLRDIWRDRLAKLSPFPTFERDGKTVFRWTQQGREWCGNNTIGIQHIYPGGQIGFDSDPALLQIARNMIEEMGRWNDGNGTNTFYPAAARVGYDPGTILRHMSDFVQGAAYSNFYMHTNGGGVESFNVVPAGLCEMLLQSFQGKIRVFADWPAGMPAKFGDLRADGGFLISSATEKGTIQFVRVISEAGATAVLVNPWPDQPVALYRNGTVAETLSGPLLTIPTSTHETILAAPSITSVNSILDQMREKGDSAEKEDRHEWH